MLNVPLLGKIYQRVVSKPPQKTIQKSWIKRTFFFALVFSAWANYPEIRLFAHTILELMALLIETPLTEQQKKEIDLKT